VRARLITREHESKKRGEQSWEGAAKREVDAKQTAVEHEWDWKSVRNPSRSHVSNGRERPEARDIEFIVRAQSIAPGSVFEENQPRQRSIR
jgi:hypothetical protein